MEFKVQAVKKTIWPKLRKQLEDLHVQYYCREVGESKEEKEAGLVNIHRDKTDCFQVMVTADNKRDLRRILDEIGFDLPDDCDGAPCEWNDED
jgi:hypothetical protein